ncbi:hypothetical protein [Shewanella sp. 10N.286.52.A9]|uniref:hypothetical protein n=1 Tax=Shewanella sp. 10N.286.52.A9 TaxID=3229711 RepID=UPI003552E684
MLEIKYTIDDITTLMYVDQVHIFSNFNKQWVTAASLKTGDKIIARNGSQASILRIVEVDTRKPNAELVAKLRDVKLSHNHHFFVTQQPQSALEVSCEQPPNDPLELIPYQLANKPSYLPNGEPTGHHSGPWVAAKYVDEVGNEFIGWGRANDRYCAEDAAVIDLKDKVADVSLLTQQNVTISHAYIRKYSKRGRLINTMSPCQYCRDNYGIALNDSRVGDSNVVKAGRDHLPIA